MSSWARGCGVAGLVAFGYLLGAAGTFLPSGAQAQVKPDKPDQLTDDTALKVKAAIDTVAAAGSALQNEQRLGSITTGTNAFAVLSGGVNAQDDLESGRGVDPETFAALYAGMAIDEIKAKLEKDENGRLTYNGKVVTLYSISRLKHMFAERERLAILKAGSAKE